MNKHFIDLQARCTTQMDLSVCNGCDHCGLRCASGVPLSGDEWSEVENHVARLSSNAKAALKRIQAQDKTVDLGDGVTVQMCRYRDMERGECSIYGVRPLVCRLLGHVEWMPCPIEKVEKRIATPDALELMQAYAQMERRTFEEWEERPAEAAGPTAF